MTRAGSRWGIIGLALAAGIVAGAQVGKVPPLLPLIRDSLVLGLVTAGWVGSIFNLVAALGGSVSGHLVDRAGARRSLVGGLALLALGVGAGALAGGATALLAARVLAGVGFLAVVVAAPRLIAESAAPGERALALGLWSTYMPAGMMLAMLATPPGLASPHGWREVWLAHAAVVTGFLALTLGVLAREPRPGSAPGGSGVGEGRMGPLRGRAALRPGPWVLGLIFGLYTTEFFAVTTWLPTFLMEVQGRDPTSASRVSALVVGANILGNLTGAWLLHRSVRGSRLQVGALLAMALCGVGIFASFSPDPVRLPAAFLFSAAGGALPAAILAGGAAWARAPSELGLVNGIIVQGANIGSLLGPPALAWLVLRLNGWSRAWILLAGLSVLGSAGAWWLARREPVENGEVEYR